MKCFVLIFIAPTVASAQLNSSAIPASCENLTSLALANATITRAESVGAGKYIVPAGVTLTSLPNGGRSEPPTPNELPAFCLVDATLNPTKDSEIKIEVWLPRSTWNEKFQAVGNGGWGGAINDAAMMEVLRRGYATASTDTGHSGNTARFAPGHPDKLVDYGYRAVHEMTVAAKSIIAAFYGDGPKIAYWNGCSTGGRQALMEAQRFPADYDGIIAGAPVNYRTHQLIDELWIAQAVHKDEASYIPPEKYPLIHDAAINKCDARDGAKDHLLENPALCRFDPKILACKNGDSASCLTAAQVEAARKIYSPVVSPRTKQQIFPGLQSGSELGWASLAGDKPIPEAVEFFQYVVFNDPNWDFRLLDFETAATLADKAENGILNAIDPNLKPFMDRGGKLLQYQGWTDQFVSPQNSINYHDSVLSTMGGPDKVQNFYRLFMVPGMNHCRNGDGPNTFDAISALEQWVEMGKAPDQIIASHRTDGKVDRTLPLCPYPLMAKYKGRGSTHDASNFACKAR